MDRWRRRSRAGSKSTSRIQFRIGSRTGNRRRRRARRAGWGGARRCRFSAIEPFGGSIETQNINRGLTYTNFHTILPDSILGSEEGPRYQLGRLRLDPPIPALVQITVKASVSWVPCPAAPSGTWRARSWLRRPRPSAGGIVAATCGWAGRLVRPGGLGLQLAPDTYLPSKTEYASAPIICVNGCRAKAARAANPSQRANNTASSEGVPPRSGSPNRNVHQFDRNSLSGARRTSVPVPPQSQGHCRASPYHGTPQLGFYQPRCCE